MTSRSDWSRPCCTTLATSPPCNAPVADNWLQRFDYAGRQSKHAARYPHLRLRLLLCCVNLVTLRGLRSVARPLIAKPTSQEGAEAVERRERRAVEGRRSLPKNRTQW